MLYQDKVYGRSVIEEPVILELLSSPVLTRLKDVDQGGYVEPNFPGTKQSRFEHSVGDFLLLRRFKASLEEQISGLIHDVSHAVFSHCIDYVDDHDSGATQDHQDNAHNDYVLNSEIPGVLEKYGLDVNFILDEKNFPLQENDIPDICADRIDYSLLGIISFGIGSKQDTDFILDNLSVVDKQWVFKNVESAQKFSEFFYQLNKDFYSGFKTAVMFKTVGDYCTYALCKKYIDYSDLYTTDSEVLKKINNFLSEDKQLKNLWQRMNDPECAVNDPENGAVMKLKSRIVDPLFMENGRIIRYSDANEKWNDVVASELKPKEYFLKFKY
jgi:uncharacterized protein